MSANTPEFIKVSIDNKHIPVYVLQIASKFVGLDEYSNAHADAVYADNPTSKQVELLRGGLKVFKYNSIQYDPTETDDKDFYPYGHGKPLK